MSNRGGIPRLGSCFSFVLSVDIFQSENANHSREGRDDRATERWHGSPLLLVAHQYWLHALA